MDRKVRIPSCYVNSHETENTVHLWAKLLHGVIRGVETRTWRLLKQHDYFRIYHTIFQLSASRNIYSSKGIRSVRTRLHRRHKSRFTTDGSFVSKRRGMARSSSFCTNGHVFLRIVSIAFELKVGTICFSDHPTTLFVFASKTSSGLSRNHIIEVNIEKNESGAHGVPQSLRTGSSITAGMKCTRRTVVV